MNIRYRVSWISTAIVALVVSAIAAPIAVQPVSVDNAKELLANVENQRLLFSKAQNALQAVPLELTQPALTEGNHLQEMARSFSRPSNRQLIPERLGFYDRRYLSLSDRRNPSLDMPLCSLITAPDTSLSYFPGILSGDAYKVWFDPSDCSTCAPAYPFRVDSVTILIIQDGGSPLDTVYIGIDIECARFDPADPCRGPGQERCFNVFRIALPADSDAFLQAWIVTLPFESCWIDGPGFLGLWHFGHTVSDDIAFHPSIAFDAENLPPVQDCLAWTSLSGAWGSWASTWEDPDPGYPVATIHGECSSTPPEPVIPCPEACTQSRIGGSLAYYNTSIYSVWEWFGVSYPDLIFPYKPTGIDFNLYYPAAGAANDSVQVMITYGCSRLYDLCCVPSDILCAGSIWLTRGTANPTLLPVSLDLSMMNCCLQEEFWLGIYLLDVGSGDAYPSFIWSDAAADPFAVPDCEQWAFLSNGSYSHWPLGELGWADMTLSGSCEECLGDTNNFCPPYIPGFLDCAGATPVACGSVTLTGQSNSGVNHVGQYCCTTWDESGPEEIYSITVPPDHNLVVSLSNISGGDVDVLVLDACNAAACLGYGDNGVELKDLDGGLYYIVVDGYLGATATFDISIDCILPCHGQLCRTLSPGTAVSTSRYYDAEWSASAPDTVFQSYWTAGTTQHILKWNPATCDTFRRVSWTSAQAAPSNILAYDPRNGGQFWTATATGVDASFTARFYRVSRTGAVLNTWSTLAGIDTMRFSGAAFDPDHNHLWVFTRSALPPYYVGGSYSNDFCYCIDVSNETNPVVIQGPHSIVDLNITPYELFSSAGADYAETADKILLMNQGEGSQNYFLCLNDVDPAYDGPPPGPGLTVNSWCPPDSNAVRGFSLAAVDNGLVNGAIQILDWTDYATPPQDIFSYPSPCPLRTCERVIDARLNVAGGTLTLYWTAPQNGDYKIYVSTDMNNDGNPDSGTDPDFSLAATVTATAGPKSWSAPSMSDSYRNYVIVAVCQ